MKLCARALILDNNKTTANAADIQRLLLSIFIVVLDFMVMLFFLLPSKTEYKMGHGERTFENFGSRTRSKTSFLGNRFSKPAVWKRVLYAADSTAFE